MTIPEGGVIRFRRIRDRDAITGEAGEADEVRLAGLAAPVDAFEDRLRKYLGLSRVATTFPSRAQPAPQFRVGAEPAIHLANWDAARNAVGPWRWVLRITRDMDQCLPDIDDAASGGCTPGLRTVVRFCRRPPNCVDVAMRSPCTGDLHHDAVHRSLPLISRAANPILR
jgi:hypothetical protein